jgi:hypothetical protein
MIFSIHFDSHYEEFNQLVKTRYLNVAGHPALPPPQVPPIPPLQQDSIISEFYEASMQPTNDG